MLITHHQEPSLTHIQICTRTSTHTNTLCIQFRWSKSKLRLNTAVQYGRSKANEAFTGKGVIGDLPKVKQSPAPLMNKFSLRCRDLWARSGQGALLSHPLHHPARAFASTGVQALAKASRGRQTGVLKNKQLTPEYFRCPCSLPAISAHYSQRSDKTRNCSPLATTKSCTLHPRLSR